MNYQRNSLFRNIQHKFQTSAFLGGASFCSFLYMHTRVVSETFVFDNYCFNLHLNQNVDEIIFAYFSIIFFAHV